MGNHGNRNLFKMTARDIRRNLLQYLSVIVITMLAVALFCGFVSNKLTLEKKVNNFFGDCNLTDLTAQFSQIGETDRDYFSQLKKDYAIGGADLEYRFYAEGKVDKKTGKIFAGKNSVSKPVIVEGGAGVLADLKLKKNDGYVIGQKINIELPNMPAVELAVTGFMHFAETANTGLYFPLYIDIDILCGEFGGINPDILYNQVLIKTTAPNAVKDAVNAHYRAQANSSLFFVYDRDTMESVAVLKGEATTSLRLIYVFPVIFLLVSVLVIMTTVSALILRERTNIGTLKGLGISNRRIMLHYACFGAALCLVGGIIGVIIGPFIVPNVLMVKYNLVYSLPSGLGIVFSPLWSAAAVLTVCALALLIGALVCRKAVKENAASCMRPSQVFFFSKENRLTEKENKVEDKKEKSFGNKRNLPLKMALRNIAIKPSRAVMTVAGVMGCTALLVCGFGIGDTVNNGVNLELGGQFKYDIATSYKAAGFLDFMDGLKADGAVTDFETYKIYDMTARTDGAAKAIKVYSVNKDLRFTAIKPDGGALISKSLAEQLKIKTGGALNLTAGANDYNLEITGIVETAVTKGVFIDSDIFDGNYHTAGMWISADESGELISQINGENGTNDAFGMKGRRESILRMISSINAIKYTITVFSIALSVVVLYNLSLLNLKERNRSIATMKVLGFSNLEISLSLFYEIMLLVLPATVLGLFLGYPILYLVLSINKIEIFSFIYKIRPLSYILASLLSLSAAAGINLVFGKLIKRVKMIDSLKSVE